MRRQAFGVFHQYRILEDKEEMRTREKGTHWVTAHEKPVIVIKMLAPGTEEMKLYTDLRLGSLGQRERVACTHKVANIHPVNIA